MSSTTIIEITLEIIMTMDQLGIPYHIGGSMASSAYGIPRSTLDVDIIADIKKEQTIKLISERLNKKYYLDIDSMKDAIKNQSSFSILHRDTLIKVDIFILPTNPFNQQAFQRRIKRKIDKESSKEVYFPTPEDIILQKIQWYKSGNEVSDKQWNDIIGVLKIQNEELDVKYMNYWANELKLTEILDKALKYLS